MRALRFLGSTSANAPSTIALLMLAHLSSLALAQQGSTAACASEVHRAFDFWLGQWEVTANGKIAGYNNISSEQNGWVIRERWKSTTPGYTGTSVNFYNGSTKQWQQLWVDNQGANLQLYGGLVDGRMVLTSQASKNEQGQILENKITWAKNEDGSVRQLWELFLDGEVAQVVFDGTYRPHSIGDGSADGVGNSSENK